MSTQDEQTTLAQLKEQIREFVDARDWNQFHAPKNLSMSLAIEVAELMEHFQWISVEESRQLKSDPARLQAIGEEIADVFAYLLALANALDLDLAETFTRKMAKTIAKYPADQFRGRYQ